MAGDGEVTRQKRKKKPKPKHVELGVAPSQSPHTSKPPPSAPFLQTPTQSPAPGTPILEEAAADVAMMKRGVCKEKKVATLPLPHNPTLEEEKGEEAVPATTKKEKKHMVRKSCPSLSAAETHTLEQEAKATKKRKPSKEHETSGNSPLPLDPGQTRSQGTKALDPSKPLPATPLLEAPAQSPSPGTSILEEAAMRKRKVRKEPKVAALPRAQNSTLEEQAEECAVATKKKKKHRKHKPSPSLSAAATATAETPILEQKAKVTKKRKICKKQEPSCLPLDPGQTQPQGRNAPHASVQSPAPGTPMLEEAAAVVMRKRKVWKEHKVPTLSITQNTTLEEQRDDAMVVDMMMESKHMEHPLPSLSTSVAAEITICEQEAKVTKKQKQRKQQEPSGKSSLPPDPGQAHCVRSQGGKAPPKKEREADGRTSSSIKENNGKSNHVRVLSKRELIKEAKKKKPALPEGFVAFSDFVSSSTEQNPDHSFPYSAFFDQFRYNPVRGDHKPTLPRTADCLARLPPRGYSSFESSQLTANETTRSSKSNTFVASKTKQLDFGSGPQEKLNVEVKQNPRKKREKKQRKPSGNLLPFNPSQSCCIPLQGTKAPPGQYQEAVARVHTPSKRDHFKEMCSQEKLHAKENKSPEETKTKKQRKRPSLLTRAEKCSDKYRRVPLDQLVSPPCSPHNLLQEKYASDPWKVIVICMLLNLTQGKQVKNIIEGFFKIYPDAQSAYNADPDKMARYLACLGLQHVKTTRIQRFSKEYVETKWTYITELCGVGKYAADAYAIFCAGRATEVVPKDHKLVDYWKYVCFELPMMQESQNAQEARVLEQELAVMC